ncbi:MAG: hypothetical protein PHO56_04200 [Patescibacteria group bacterium]|nr:hypothetical protein [Patescibacteria group bacterium]
MVFKAEKRKSISLKGLLPLDQLFINPESRKMSVFGGRQEGLLGWEEFSSREQAYESVFGSKKVSTREAIEIIKEKVDLETEMEVEGKSGYILLSVKEKTS